MLAIVTVFLVAKFNAVSNKSRDTLLTVIKMHESTNMALHIGLIASVFEQTTELHHLISFH